jgi:uncharacterized protein YdgA (DUF945 family)
LKKIVWIAVLLGLVLGAAPLAIGKLAEQRVDKGLDQLLAAAPYLSIVERRYSSGWFSSEQVVTFELFGPWTRALQSALPAQNAMPVPESPSSRQPQLQFTVRNEIHHGPVLGAALGIARIDSHIVWSDAVRSWMRDAFGEKEPFAISTRIGFFGGATTVFSSEARTVKDPHGKDLVSWDDARLVIGYSRNFDRVDAQGQWPRAHITNAGLGENLLIRGMSVSGAAKRLRGDVYEGNAVVSIEQIEGVSGSDEKLEVSNLSYRIDTTEHGDFIDAAVKLGAGPIEARAQSFKDAHYDFTLRRLHIETLAKMSEALKAAYRNPLDNADPYRTFGMQLLRHDPEFAIDRFSVSNAQGEGLIKGVIKLKGVTDADLEAASLALISKVVADIDIDVSAAMLQKFMGQSAADNAVAQGYLIRSDGHLRAKLELADGKVKINGKSEGFPVFGAPKPQPLRPE